MRALATLTALLMLLSPLAAANEHGGGDGQGGSGPRGGSGSTNSTSSTSSGPGSNSTSGEDGEEACPMPDRRPSTQGEVQACKERTCSERPEQRACRGERLEEEREAAENESAGRAPREWQAWCRGEAREDEERSRCRAELARFGGQADGKWVSFAVDAANATLLDYRVAGHPVLDSLRLETGSDNLTVRATGSALRLGDADTELVLHDDPTGLVRLKASDGWLLMALPNGTAVAPSADGTMARLTYADDRVAHLRVGNATWLDDRTVLAEGFAALLVHPPEEKSEDGQDGEDDQEARAAKAEVKQAVAERKVGAEVTLHGPPAARAASAGEAPSPVQVLEYDDLHVEVRLPAAQVATAEAPIRVEVSAELDEGRTIVLNVNRALLATTDPSSLVLRYFDLHGQADGTVVETEVVFKAAGGLQDILDPTDDAGQPEYWVVQDANGLQLLASVPHWSAHAITIGSLAVLNVSPNVAVGIAVGVAGSVIAAVAMLWPRRRMDE